MQMKFISIFAFSHGQGLKVVTLLFRKVVYHNQSLLIIMSNRSSNEYPDSEEELDYISIYILMKTAKAIVEHATPLYDKTLYHTSAL